MRSFCLILVLGLAACAQKNHAPVINSKLTSAYKNGVHTVQKGETLYAIAWQYGYDYAELADINAIDPPYTVYSGQTISFFKDKSRPAKIITRHLQEDTRSITAASTTTRGSGAILAKKPTAHTTETVSKLTWIWPSQGRIIQQFNLRMNNKGINIAGKLGQKIVAAADGQVVYTGSGLPAYGKLIIIKHNKHYLSAYAYNRRIVVHEGDWVKQGQKVAEMGKNSTQQGVLHFEIRLHGKPVDPANFLT